MIVKEDFDKEKIAESMTVLWEPLTPDQRKYLVDHIKVHLFEKNETVYKQNEQPTYLMCLLKGKIKVYMNGVGGRTQIIRVIEQMGIFSYRAAFVNENYKTSASAFEASTVCMIPINVIRSIIEENNELAVFFIRQLCKMLGEADALTVNLTQKHMRGRLAESLIILKNKYGYEDDGSTLSIYLSREELANMSNMTTSNAIRILSSLASENIIITDGRKIKIIDEHRLCLISENGG